MENPPGNAVGGRTMHEVRLQASLPHQTSFTKHKLEYESIENVKMLTTEHETISMEPLRGCNCAGGPA